MAPRGRGAEGVVAVTNKAALRRAFRAEAGCRLTSTAACATVNKVLLLAPGLAEVAIGALAGAGGVLEAAHVAVGTCRAGVLLAIAGAVVALLAQCNRLARVLRACGGWELCELCAVCWGGGGSNNTKQCCTSVRVLSFGGNAGCRCTLGAVKLGASTGRLVGLGGATGAVVPGTALALAGVDGLAAAAPVAGAALGRRRVGGACGAVVAREARAAACVVLEALCGAKAARGASRGRLGLGASKAVVAPVAVTGAALVTQPDAAAVGASRAQDGGRGASLAVVLLGAGGGARAGAGCTIVLARSAVDTGAIRVASAAVLQRSRGRGGEVG